MNAHAATTAELRAAFNRAAPLQLLGWTFERAMAAPLVAWSLQKSALATRRHAEQPIHPALARHF